MAGIAERDRAARDARRGPTRCLAAQIGLLGGIQSVAPSVGIELRPVDLRDADELEQAISRRGRSKASALIISVISPFDQIASLLRRWHSRLLL